MEIKAKSTKTATSSTSFPTAVRTFVRFAPTRRRKIIPLPTNETSGTMTNIAADITALQDMKCGTPAAWHLESATIAQRALNPIVEETAISYPQPNNQFPIEQIFTRTVILRRSTHNASPKRTPKTNSPGATKSAAGKPTAQQASAVKSASRAKSAVCATAGCRKGKKMLIPRPDEERSEHGDFRSEKMRFDRCAGVETTPRIREFKRTVFSKIAEESFKVRRVCRKKAKPMPMKGQVKTTKAAQLRFKFIRNQAVASSLTQAHMKKYRKPPFKAVGVLRVCYEKLGEKLEKLKVLRKARSKSPAKRKKARSKKK